MTEMEEAGSSTSVSSITPVKMMMKDFLECFPPPQSGRIVDGFTPDFDADEAFDLPKGTVLNFHRQVSPNVPLSFKDPWGGPNADHYVKVTLPLEFQGKFNLLPYDPDSESQSLDHVYATVEKLIKAFPIYIQANASFQNKPDQDQEYEDDIDLLEYNVRVGDRLKLIRLVHKHQQKLLECRLLSETRLILLPMDCVGNFTVLPDNNDYLLSDLMSMLPRKRRLVVADSTRNIHKIPGLSIDFRGYLFLEEPEAFVEASPMEDPSLIIGLPSTLGVLVSPEENSYDRGQLLNSFATNNRNLFPVVARVTDWDEETTILENHYVKPGIELVIHGWTRQSKILAEANGKYYAIPLTYQGKFRIKPDQFHGTSELEHSHPAYAVRVIEGDPLIPLVEGDVLRIRRDGSVKRPHAKSGEIQYLKCEKLEPNGKFKEIKLPMSSHAVFEEILEGNKSTEEYHIREMVTFVNDSEVVVELVAPTVDQKIQERDMPVNMPITLCEYVVESAVYVSVETAEAPAFHIPLRTLIYVTFVQQLDKSTSPLLTKQNPRLSTLDRCVEILPSYVFHSLRPQTAGSEFEGTDSLGDNSQTQVTTTTAW